MGAAIDLEGGEKMQVIYEVHTGLDRNDYADENEARAAVEAKGSGYYVKFVRGYDGRDRSCGMTVFEDGAWRGVDISVG